MKARPILFSAEMVRALLDGRKTQTRRALKSQPLDILPMEGDKAGREWIILEEREPQPKGKVIRCRFGVRGDLLWVRETYREHDSTDQNGRTVEYRADRPEYVKRNDDPSAINWRPSIHMPRWASRLTLRITNIRVERLQDISEEDAIAEGVEFETADPPFYYVPGVWPHSITAVEIEDGAVRSYGKLWNHINGAGAWEANPWVWAITFDVIKANVDQVLREVA